MKELEAMSTELTLKSGTDDFHLCNQKVMLFFIWVKALKKEENTNNYKVDRLKASFFVKYK